MKKILFILLSSAFAFAISCGGDSSSSNQSTTGTTMSAAQDESFSAALVAISDAMNTGIGSVFESVKMIKSAKGMSKISLLSSSAKTSAATIDYTSADGAITVKGSFSRSGSDLTMTLTNLTGTYVDDSSVSHTTSISGSGHYVVTTDADGNETTVATASFTDITVDGTSCPLSYALTFFDDYTALTERLYGTVTFGTTVFTIDETGPLEEVTVAE
jgi:hypothetical protein